jgi:hypothetical protein
MIQATINDNLIETFLYQKFEGDKKKITDYINDFLHKYLPNNNENIAFEEDKKRFQDTYARIQDGTEKMLTEEESNRRREEFINNLCK